MYAFARANVELRPWVQGPRFPPTPPRAPRNSPMVRPQEPESRPFDPKKDLCPAPDIRPFKDTPTRFDPIDPSYSGYLKYAERRLLIVDNLHAHAINCSVSNQDALSVAAFTAALRYCQLPPYPRIPKHLSPPDPDAALALASRLAAA